MSDRTPILSEPVNSCNSAARSDLCGMDRFSPSFPLAAVEHAFRIGVPSATLLSLASFISPSAPSAKYGLFGACIRTVYVTSNIFVYLNRFLRELS